MNTEDSEFERIEREQAMRGVPDAIHHTDTNESLEYITGWNDCRAAMLEKLADHHDPIGTAQDMLIAEQAAQAHPAPVQEPFLVRLYNEGYRAGHHDTVENRYTHVLPQDLDTYHFDVVAEWLVENPQAQPAPEIAIADAYRAGVDSGIAAEREACAKVCESQPMRQDIDVREQCAAAIRARTNT